MKKKACTLFMAAVMAVSLTGCGQQNAAPAQSAPATEAPTEAPAATPEATPEAVSETEEDVSEPEAPQEEIYASEAGWVVRYDPTVIHAESKGDPEYEVNFVYTGESGGSNLVTITMIDDKLPAEVIEEMKDTYKNLTVSEMVFPGTDDKLAYRIDTGESDEGSGLHEDYILGEYSNGTLCFLVTTHNSGDDEIDIPVSDALAMIIDSIEYENFGEQNAEPYKESSSLPAYEYPGPELFYSVIYQYVVDELSEYYDPAAVTIPSVVEVAIDDSDKDDIKYYGDFWIFNYDLDGETLVTKSGGNYPGVIHLKNTDEGYEVTSIEIAEDGSDFDESAKKLFGDYYDDFTKIFSDDNLQEKVRAQIIANYVAANELPITAYQDEGWDPIPLPEENIDSFYSDLL